MLNYACFLICAVAAGVAGGFYTHSADFGVFVVAVLNALLMVAVTVKGAGS